MSGPVDVLAVMDVEIDAFRKTEAVVKVGVPGRWAAYADHLARLTEARAAVAELIEADQEAIDTLDSLIHAMALPMPDALHMKALRAALPRLLEAKRAALARCRGEV